MFQDPDLRLLAQCQSVLDDLFGLQVSPVVWAIEISIDFTPKQASADRLARMVGVLSRHIFPDRDFMMDEYDRPRFSWCRGFFPTFLMRKRNEMAAADDQPAPVDATFFVGARDAPVSWHVGGSARDAAPRQDRGYTRPEGGSAPAA
jgi:hypothetical protein